MPETIPLIPLGSVLFPGIPLSLHLFEERYRELVEQLLRRENPQDRRFGVVAIRQGWEVGLGAVRAVHRVGCTAIMKRASPYPDGRYDLDAVGSDRFRLLTMDDAGAAYLQGRVEWLPRPCEPTSLDDKLAHVVSDLYRQYVKAVGTIGGDRLVEQDLPTDPTALSYVVASLTSLPLDERQSLLECATTTARLHSELRLLRREVAMLYTLRATPIPFADLPRPQSPN